MEPTPDPAAEPQAEQIEMEISPEGVDLSVIRWFRSLTPTERLEVLQDWVDGALALRAGRVREPEDEKAKLRLYTLENAPEDYEPETQEEAAAVEKAWREYREGKSLTTQELKRELGFP